MSRAPALADPGRADPETDAVAAFDRLAHDLRSPLASVRTALQMLRMPGLDPARAHELVDLADRQLMRAVALADAVADYARLREGRLTLDREPIAVVRLLADVADRIRGATGGTAPRVEVAPDAGSVTADPMHLSQAIALLLEPAMRRARPVLVGARRVGPNLVIDADAGLDDNSTAITDLLGAALVAAHGGRVERHVDRLSIMLPGTRC